MKSPFSESVSQPGFSDSTASVGWCVSPTTRERVVLARSGPTGERASASGRSPAAGKPDLPGGDKECAADTGSGPGREIVPALDDVVEDRIVRRDQIEEGIFAFVGERLPTDARDREQQADEPGNDKLHATRMPAFSDFEKRQRRFRGVSGARRRRVLKPLFVLNQRA